MVIGVLLFLAWAIPANNATGGRIPASGHRASRAGAERQAAGAPRRQLSAPPAVLPAGHCGGLLSLDAASARGGLGGSGPTRGAGPLPGVVPGLGRHRRGHHDSRGDQTASLHSVHVARDGAGRGGDSGGGLERRPGRQRSPLASWRRVFLRSGRRRDVRRFSGGSVPAPRAGLDAAAFWSAAALLLVDVGDGDSPATSRPAAGQRIDSAGGDGPAAAPADARRHARPREGEDLPDSGRSRETGDARRRSGCDL